MNKLYHICLGIFLLIIASCTSRKSTTDTIEFGVDSVTLLDSTHSEMQPATPVGMHPGGQPLYLPHEESGPPHEPDNMRGFDPASEDDMDDNGMSRYMENDDEEGWD